MKCGFALGVVVFIMAGVPLAQAQTPSTAAAAEPAAAEPAPVAPAAEPAATVEGAPSDAKDTAAAPSAAPASEVPATNSAPAAPRSSGEKSAENASFDDDVVVNDDPRPSTGLGFVITGWIVSGVGAVNLAAIPLCSEPDFVQPSQKDLCVELSVGVGIAGLGIGIPLLIVGYNKSATFKEWKRNHATIAQLLNTQVAIQNDGAMVVYKGSF